MEQRNSRRFPILDTTTKVRKKGGLFWCLKSNKQICEVINISLGGYCFLSEAYYKPQTAVEIELYMNDTMFNLDGKICYTAKLIDGFCLGIRFLNIDLELVRQIRQHTGSLRDIGKEAKASIT